MVLVSWKKKQKLSQRGALSQLVITALSNLIRRMIQNIREDMWNVESTVAKNSTNYNCRKLPRPP